MKTFFGFIALAVIAMMFKSCGNNRNNYSPSSGGGQDITIHGRDGTGVRVQDNGGKVYLNGKELK